MVTSVAAPFPGVTEGAGEEASFRRAVLGGRGPDRKKGAMDSRKTIQLRWCKGAFHPTAATLSVVLAPAGGPDLGCLIPLNVVTPERLRAGFVAVAAAGPCRRLPRCRQSCSAVPSRARQRLPELPEVPARRAREDLLDEEAPPGDTGALGSRSPLRSPPASAPSMPSFFAAARNPLPSGAW